MDKNSKLSRESLLNGEMHALAKSHPGTVRLMPDDVRDRMVAETIAQAPNQSEFWVFAYGSLIWNPAIEFESKCRCSISNYHRSFCFWTVFSRGSEEQPGLMMGLEEGGECDGIAYRISANNLKTEVDILFRREMISYVYKPTWIKARCFDTGKDIDVLTFVVDEQNERFCGQLDEETIVKAIALAVGPIGRNCDYLYQLVDNLTELGFEDPVMTDLKNKVQQYQAKHQIA